MRIKQYSDIFDVINEIEESLPVDTWLVGGFHVWPLVRLEIGRVLFRGLAKAGSGPGNPPRNSIIPHFARQLLLMLKDFANERLVGIIDSKANASLCPVDACFFIQNVDRQLFEGSWWDRFSDAFVAMAKSKFSWAAMEWTNVERHRTPRRNHSRFVQSRINLCRLKARLATTKSFKDEISRLPGYDELMRRIGELTSDTSHFSPPYLARLIAYLLTLEKFFAGVLAKTQPALGLAPCYYGIEGLAFNLACHKRGVVSVDLQHGVAGNGNVAYGRWRKVPKRGYELLPRVFWSWSKDDADAVNDWARVSPSHFALNGGNPWLMMLGGGSPLPPDNSVGTKGRKVSILVSLAESLALPSWLLGLLKEGHPSIEWHIRRHPTNKNLELGDIGADERVDVESRQATDLPLPIVLSKVDLHVTEWSAVALDALALGIPTVVVHEIGSEVFAKQIADGTMKYAKDRVSFEACVFDHDFLASARASREASCKNFHAAMEELTRLAFGTVDRGEKPDGGRRA